MSILKRVSIWFSLVTLILLFQGCMLKNESVRERQLFTSDWKFYLGEIEGAESKEFNDSNWQSLCLPHDWSIEGKFSADNPATPGGGALPGGIGWYRKEFKLAENLLGKNVFIDFDGIYQDSEVWINGEYLGKRPNGYISFRYDLTPYLNFGEMGNTIAVKVDNSKQPNSRWYSGSGIYRNVWLNILEPVYVDLWGTYVTTPSVSGSNALVSIKTSVVNSAKQDSEVKLVTTILDKDGNEIANCKSNKTISANTKSQYSDSLEVKNPNLWSVENPYLYSVVSKVYVDNKLVDNYTTTLGIRSFEFSTEKGFLLNGKQVKIKGVCNHHDLGFLGSAINNRALERQLELLKKMGCNGIRTSHNPPAPELLDLCDRMGFIVMDEMLDIWSKKKTEYDYSKDWNEWHAKDLRDFVQRDRNHPSVFIWSIGNEVIEQYDHNDPLGAEIAKELRNIVLSFDTTRPITAACNDKTPDNPIIKSGALDIIGYNYGHQLYESIPEVYPGKPFISTESESSLHTRGSYDMPSDSIRRWPYRWDEPFLDGNKDNTCSAYDNCSAPWGSTHEETWKIVKKNDFISGAYIWTGFDYLGEPTPYSWPSRSSYFGLIDLAGFPKDAYYFYQSEWTDEPMLHLFPHWNWAPGETIDIWAYTNCDEVELFVNGNSLGSKTKTDDMLHMQWRVQFEEGNIKAVAKKDGKVILEKQINTAGEPAQIKLEADRKSITADGKDLSFITVSVLDKNGNLVPNANNLINFKVVGNGKLAGVDNGLQTSHESFYANYRKAFSGLCLAVVQSNESKGEIELTASSEGLISSTITVLTK